MLQEHCKSSSKEHLRWDVGTPGVRCGPPTATLVKAQMEFWHLQSHLHALFKGFFKPQAVLPCLKNRTSGIYAGQCCLKDLSVDWITSAIDRFCNAWVFLNPYIPQHFISSQPSQLPGGIWLC